MATALRNFVNNGSWNTSDDYVPYVHNGSGWVKTHACVNNGSTWIQIPNWEYTGNDYPLSALTSNTAPSPYSCSASSQYSSTYAPWKAFNKSYSDANGWAGTNTDTAPWIRLYFAVPLKNIYIQLYNRTRASLVNGVISATIQGSDNGSTWTTIGTISGRNGTSSAYGSTHYCNNYDNTYTWIQLVITDWANRNASTDKYVSIGEIYIYGKQDS